MKINDYFLEAKKISLSEHQKSQIFDQIHKQIASEHTTSSYHKMLKYIAISSGTLLAVFAFVPILNQPTNIQLKNGLISSIGGSSYVKANQVGEILTLSGNLFINGVETKDTKIYQDQNLYLGSGKIEFNIGNGSKGVIIGPANFSIHKIGEKYEIEIISGNYIQISEKNISNENVALKTKQVYITKTDTTKPFEVTLTNQSGDIQISSPAQNINIETIKGEKFVLEAEKTVKINPEIEKIAFETSSISSQISSGEVSSTSFENIEPQQKPKYTYTKQDEEKNIQNFSSSKNIEKNKEVEDLLYPSFLDQDVKQYQISYENGDEKANIVAYQNIVSRMNRVYEKLNIDYRVDPTTINVSQASQNLKQELKNFENYTNDYQTQATKKFSKNLNLTTLRKFGYKAAKKPTSSSSNINSSSSIFNSSVISSSNKENFSSSKNSETNSPTAQIIRKKIEILKTSSSTNSKIEENIDTENDGNGEKK